MEQKQDNSDVDALEKPEAAGAASAPLAEEGKDPKKDDKSKKAKTKGSIVQRVTGKFNVYLLIFILLVIIVVGVAIVSYNQQKTSLNPADIPSQQLDESAFGQLQDGESMCLVNCKSPRSCRASVEIIGADTGPPKLAAPVTVRP